MMTSSARRFGGILLLIAAFFPPLPGHALPLDPDVAAFIGAAEGQVGVTTIYDPSYVGLDFPNGDVPPERGVCTDVVIRAMRDAYGIDLQAVINADMNANFSAYPQNWGLTRTDRNIDHRRVPNLQRLFERVNAELPLSSDIKAFQPGDIVTSMLPGNLPNMMIVTDQTAADGAPLVAHNIGAGARVENALFSHELMGHYRLTPEVLGRLRDMQP